MPFVAKDITDITIFQYISASHDITVRYFALQYVTMEAVDDSTFHYRIVQTTMGYIATKDIAVQQGALHYTTVPYST